jgi:RNA polymerase sigma factor (sigma-70 family)
MAEEAYLVSLAVEAAATYAAPRDLNQRDFITPAYFALLKMDARSKIPLQQNTSNARRLALIQEVVAQIKDVDAFKDEDSRFLHTDSSPFERACQAQCSQHFSKAFLTLHPREERVLRMLHGFHEDREFTLDEIAATLCVTRERVRQIGAKGIRKLRHPSRSRRIRTHADDVIPDTFNSGPSLDSLRRPPTPAPAASPEPVIGEDDKPRRRAVSTSPRPFKSEPVPIRRMPPPPRLGEALYIAFDHDPFDVAA